MVEMSGRTTVALTQEATEISARLEQRFPLGERMHVAKLAMAYAIQAGADPGRQEDQPSGTGTTWNVGSLDKDGELRSLIQAVFPEHSGDPYRAVESLMNKGFVLIGEALSAGRLTAISDLMGERERA
jgi:hypothetical protein